MSNPIITVNSNPNNVVTANIGSLFYRLGSQTFRMIDGTTGKDVELNVNAAAFLRTKYNPVFYRNYSFEFSSKYETWIKISGDGTSKGWQYVSADLPYFKGTSPGGPPVITQQPEDQQINVGSNAAFSISTE
jgi:hypothetical protein